MTTKTTDENPLPALPADEYAALRTSIQRDGFAYPVIKSAGPAMFGHVVDGFHRLKIAAELGIEPPIVSERFADETAFRLRQIDLNLARRQLTTVQKVVLGMAREPWERRRVEEERRGKIAAARASGASATEAEPVRATALVAEAVGLKRDTYEHGKFVFERGPDYIKAQLRAGAITIDRAYRESKRVLGMNASAVLESTVSRRVGAFPRGTWSCVIVDPPWRDDPKRAQPGRLAAAEIGALPVRDVLAEDALVGVWCSTSALPDAYAAIAAWGARPVQVVVWTRGSRSGTLLRDATEFCVLGVVGRFAPPERSKASNIVTGTMGEQTGRLPESFFEAVDSIAPEAEGLVLFGSITRTGWRAAPLTVK